MLDEFKTLDSVVYKQLSNSLDKLSHAYLFNLNNNIYALDMIMAFIKNIICINMSDEEANIICNKIDNNNYLDVKKIYPDGLWIKKEQLEELQETFSTKSIENNKRIYIIYEAEKLNKSAGNSLLKFLEEPCEGIIAILLTNNINSVLNTISSRCQIINFKKNNVSEYIKYNKFTNDITLNKLAFTVWKIRSENIEDYHREFILNTMSFVKKYEDVGKKMIVYTKQYFHDKFKEKEEVLNFFDLIILFYSDVINYKINGQVIYYDDYIEFIKKVSNKNELSKLVNKMNVILEKEQLVKNNVNINMLIDNMIISMEE